MKGKVQMTMYMKIFSLALAMLLFSSCGGGGAAAIDLSGTWDIVFDNSGGPETHTIELTASGNGTYTETTDGSPSFPGMLTMNGNSITWLTGDQGDPLTITAILGADGKSMQGSGIATADGSTFSFDAQKR